MGSPPLRTPGKVPYEPIKHPFRERWIVVQFDTTGKQVIWMSAIHFATADDATAHANSLNDLQAGDIPIGDPKK